ncbi:MAG: D-xylose ABC transporter ATP-binding protein [Candidatus Melainabacteria bacterium]|nr:MAG: D-xylose ABC transporter ATP-binding protein [Candidatus Melainabacteria bacterium]
MVAERSPISIGLTDQQNILEVRDISKAFPGVQALSQVNLRLSNAEVLALIGENGAGKSTLMKILAGIIRPDAGDVYFNGRKVLFNYVRDAERLGIVLIHQELNLVENLDVASNIFLGRERTYAGPLRLIDQRNYSKAAVILKRVGLDCAPNIRVSQLALGQRQLVEIARALSVKAKVLIMDEPTSSLTSAETFRLFDIISELKQSGVSVVYISHRLKEVELIADRVVGLKDGANSGELQRSEINHQTMVQMMVGRELKQLFQDQRRVRTEVQPVLEVKNLRTGLGHEPIEFVVNQGEIVGLSGLMGAGRTELAEVLFGIRRPLGGEVLLNGKKLPFGTTGAAIKAGAILVPEDRRTEGLILSSSVATNINLPSLKRLSTGGLRSFKRERQLSEKMCAELNVRTPNIKQVVGLLSGGNQQKIVLAKWLACNPSLLIFDEPTRGVDIGAKSEIYALMHDLADRGVAILMISSDLEEILGMSDRVIVLHQGSIAGELSKIQLTEEAIMHLSTGGHLR